MSDRSGWPWYANAFAGVVIAGSAYWFYNTAIAPHGFSDEDISNAKDYIRNEFSKRDGITVKDVELIRDGANKLTGFVKFEFLSIEASKACSALMDSHTNQYIVRCD